MAKDPICGMDVNEADALAADRGGETYYFCSEHCRQKFLASDDLVTAAAGHECCHSDKSTSRTSGTTPTTPGTSRIYTCPMHPEVEQNHPGICPKCGMELEPKFVAADEEEDDSELRSMTLRFWVSVVLGLPVLLLAMLPAVGVPIDELIGGGLSRWLQFGLSTPVVLWAGWPFFVRGWRSVVTWNLNMFTLIAIGVGAAMALSQVMETLLFSVSRRDPVTFIAVPVALVIVAGLACFLPARRAMRVDPVVALRVE